MNNGEIPFERAILMLRRTLFPFMHDPCLWVEGIVFDEQFTRSFLALVSTWIRNADFENLRLIGIQVKHFQYWLIE